MYKFIIAVAVMTLSACGAAKQEETAVTADTTTVATPVDTTVIVADTTVVSVPTEGQPAK